MQSLSLGGVLSPLSDSVWVYKSWSPFCWLTGFWWNKSSFPPATSFTECHWISVVVFGNTKRLGGEYPWALCSFFRNHGLSCFLISCIWGHRYNTFKYYTINSSDLLKSNHLDDCCLTLLLRTLILEETTSMEDSQPIVAEGKLQPHSGISVHQFGGGYSDLKESDTTERLNWTELNWTLMKVPADFHVATSNGQFPVLPLQPPSGIGHSCLVHSPWNKFFTW